jgi:hypothetical protein
VGAVVLLLLVGGIAGYAATSGGTHRRPVPWGDVTAQAGPARWARPTISIIRDAKKLAKLFQVATLPPTPRVPRIDFSRHQAILITVGPRSSTGYSLRVESVTAGGGSIRVVVREHTPSLGEHVRPVLTFPYKLLTLPRQPKTVHVHFAGR